MHHPTGSTSIGHLSASRSIAIAYDLSDEMRRRHVDVLERRYGGRANSAARVIQRAYRQHRLQQVSHSRESRSISQHWTLVRQPPALSLYASSRASSYHPLTSLRAQLRTARNVAPPPPAPRAACCDHMLSPRFTQRRLIDEHVWVPRGNRLLDAANHSNSLPRLDRQKASGETRLPPAITRNWSERQRRRHYRVALNFFNKKPDRGMELLVQLGFVDDNPEAIARMLRGRRGLSKASIGEFIATLHSALHAAVLDCFVAAIDLADMEVDIALRHLLTFFRLPGEAQKIDRCMAVFARRYCECNAARVATFAGGQDTVYILAFAIVMLNTDAHSRSIKNDKRMKEEEFVKNLRGVDGGRDIDRDLLIGIYNRVRQEEFRPGSDHITQVLKVEQSLVGKTKPRLAESHRRLVCFCRLHAVLDANKKQASTAHQRELFLFNDLIIVTKLQPRNRKTSTYELREWFSLLGARIEPFQTGLYAFGLALVSSEGRELLLNAKNDEDRYRFLADVRESIAETQEMETVRIEHELHKQRLNREDSERDSGLPDIDSSSSSNPSSQSTQRQLPSLVRRLSLNSLDSGMVEEPCELSS